MVTSQCAYVSTSDTSAAVNFRSINAANPWCSSCAVVARPIVQRTGVYLWRIRRDCDFEVLRSQYCRAMHGTLPHGSHRAILRVMAQLCGPVRVAGPYGLLVPVTGW